MKTCTTCTEFFQSDKISKPFISGWSVPIDASTPANIIFDTRTDIIEYVQKLCLLMMMIWTLFIMILTLKLVIMLTLVCSVDRPTLSPLTNTEIAINLLCDKDIDDDVMTSRMSFLILNRY